MKFFKLSIIVLFYSVALAGCAGELEYDRSLEIKPGSKANAGGEDNNGNNENESTRSLSEELAKLAVGQPFRMWTCAHRADTYKGRQEGIPNNSVAAVEYAIAAGVDMVELDSRETKDGTIVIMHNTTINETTTGTGSVAGMTYDDIKKYTLKTNTGVVTEYKVPTLEEVLDAAKNKVYVCLDIKEPSILPRIMKVVDAKKMIDQVCVYHNATSTIDALKKYNPNSIPFPWVGDAAAVQMIAKFYPSVKLVQFGFDDDTPTAKSIAKSVNDAKLVGYANHLLAPDEAMLGGDYSLIDKFIANRVHIAQTDYGDKMNEYLKKKGVR